MKNRGPASLSQMTNRTRNLLLFIALAGAALGTWVLSRGPEPERETSASAAQPERGLYMTGATLYGTDEEGRIQFQVEADRVEQEKSGDPLQIQMIRVSYASNGNASWEISATQGVASADLRQLELKQDVQLTYLNSDTGEALIFETANLTLDGDEHRVSSEDWVSLREDSTVLSGWGLSFDLETGAYDCCKDGGSQNAR